MFPIQFPCNQAEPAYGWRARPGRKQQSALWRDVRDGVRGASAAALCLQHAKAVRAVHNLGKLALCTATLAMCVRR